MGGLWSSGAARAADVLLRVAGRAVVVRVRQSNASGGELPRMEAMLKPCVVRVAGATAEMVASADAVAKAGGPAELFAATARVVVDDVVWRVLSCSPVMCGEAVVCWKVELAR